MTSHGVIIRLTHDQAVVLSEWLSEVMGTPGFDDLVNQDRAVWSPLHTLSGVLETALADIFSPDYEGRLHEARQRLLDQLGDLGGPLRREGRDAESGSG
ncbi:MAG TPA: hypothetical protein VFP72_08925 [Kineosporiaceae bacterium]|nr:hypothetical protein [Kineosporiaceae bacterium]